MKTFEYTIIDPVGIHPRPAGVLSKKAREFVSKIILTNQNGKSVDSKKATALIGLNVKSGETIHISVDGDDEELAKESLQTFFHEYL